MHGDVHAGFGERAGETGLTKAGTAPRLDSTEAQGRQYSRRRVRERPGDSDRVAAPSALLCPLCEHSTRARYDSRDVDSRWRHLDLGAWRLEIRARLRRLSRPTHGVRVEGVPFARHRSEFTRDFEDLVAWLAAKTDKTAIERLLRIAWRTVGAIVERVVSDELDPERLNDLFEIGIDEVSWRKQHNYLTLVSNHRSGKVVWGAEGKDTKTADGFFDELGKERSAQLSAVSMDMGKAYLKSVSKEEHAPQATVCIDPFHVVALATTALDDVRRAVWNDMRAVDDKAAKKFKDARWSLMKNPDNLTDKQAATLRRLKRRGGDLWRAYRLKESCRAIFAGDLDPDEVEELLDRLASQASAAGWSRSSSSLGRCARTGAGSSQRFDSASTTDELRASTMSFA